MGQSGSRHRRGSREQTTGAILDAAERLFAERGFTAVTVRGIAAEAGVSHALVHRYLGSKQQVYRAMLARRENLIRDAASGDEDLLEATSLMLREAVLNQRTYVRLIAHRLCTGCPTRGASGGSPPRRGSSSSPSRPRPTRANRGTRTLPTRVSSSPRSSRC